MHRDEVACGTCGDRVPREHSIYTSEGRVCWFCHGSLGSDGESVDDDRFWDDEDGFDDWDDDDDDD